MGRTGPKNLPGTGKKGVPARIGSARGAKPNPKSSKPSRAPKHAHPVTSNGAIGSPAASGIPRNAPLGALTHATKVTDKGGKKLRPAAVPKVKRPQ